MAVTLGATSAHKIRRIGGLHTYNLSLNEHTKTMTPAPAIRGFHAHVYFGPQTVDQARALCEEAAARFDLKLGRMHHKPVGPHPDWSCQLAFKPALFGDVIPWLAQQRGGLVIFVHPISDNDLLDHRDRAMWMGAVRTLDLSVLDESPGHYDL